MQDVMILVDHFSVSDLNLASPADLACIQALAQVHPKDCAWRVHVLCIRVMCVCVLCFGVLCILESPRPLGLTLGSFGALSPFARRAHSSFIQK